MLNHKVRFTLILIGLLLLSAPAGAQTAGSAILAPPETTRYPIIHAYLEAYDGQGRFIHDLQEKDVQIIEDQKRIPILELNEMETGAQVVVAVDLGPAFAIRDSNGISRYDTVQSAIINWATNHTTPLDDLSLLTNDSPDKIHLPDAVQFLNSFHAYESDPRTATPSLDVLVRAINVASDPTPRIGMGRTILLLTSPPNRTGFATLQSIISLARQERIRIYVWMISPPELFTSEGATLLVELANQTGGQFFAFSGTETFPNLDDYLAPLRYIYTLSYESQIRNGENHQVIAEINTNDLEITSPPQDFNLQVMSPNPIFLSPPLEVFRANRSALSETLSEGTDYTPEVQGLEILVEFPDGYPRPLARTVLFVDGKIMDENTSPPFDRFTWDLSEYTSSSEHFIQVEAIDTLDFRGISIEKTVQITVQQTPQSVISTMVQNAPTIAGAAVSVAGGVLVLVLIIRGRIKPKAFGRTKVKRITTQINKSNTKPIDTQSVPLVPAVQRKRISNWVNRFSWPQRSSPSPKPVAYLEIYAETSNNSEKELIPISIDEITFGKDPKQATTIINDPAVDDLHARLRVNHKGDITIQDEGSIAGTWVNFSPIATEDVKLSHGDIIHIGRIGLCLKFTDKNQIPKPIVRSQELRS